MVTDGDVTDGEIGQVLDSLGYHGVGVSIIDELDHEHPCPSVGCLDDFREAGHIIPDNIDCCICWIRGTV
jgi:hypothetical protein